MSLVKINLDEKGEYSFTKEEAVELAQQLLDAAGRISEEEEEDA